MKPAISRRDETHGLVTDREGAIVDDTAFPVDVCDNGDV